MSVPAVTAAGPVLVRARSATPGPIVVSKVAVLLAVDYRGPRSYPQTRFEGIRVAKPHEPREDES